MIEAASREQLSTLKKIAIDANREYDKLTRNRKVNLQEGPTKPDLQIKHLEQRISAAQAGIENRRKDIVMIRASVQRANAYRQKVKTAQANALKAIQDYKDAGGYWRGI